MKPIPLTALLITITLGLIPCQILADDLSSQAQEPKEKKGEIWIEPITGMKFVWVEGGCFQMGQLSLETRLLKREVGEYDYDKYYADELPRHKVCLNGFWMGITEVTQNEWLKIMKFNPSHFNTDKNFPVDTVSWEDANNFIDKLNKDSKSSAFRLPTEAEWEFAARGGTENSMYHTGNSITTDQANYNGSIAFGLNLKEKYLKSPVRADSFPPNSFGIHNMHGNVWEWCNDWYGEEYYSESKSENPSGPKKGDMRVLRGGSWFRYSGHIRSATRYKNKPTGQYADTGFRVIKSSSEVAKKGPGKFIFDQNF